MRTSRHVHDRTRTRIQAPLGAALALAVGLGLGGCAETGQSGSSPKQGPLGSWGVESLTTGGRTLHAPDAARVDLTQTEAKGNYGCNGFTARVALEGDAALTVTPGLSTTMACADTEFETAFAKLFRGRLSVDRGPDRLTLKAADGSTIAMTTKPPAPDAPLTATEWTVESQLDGAAAASLPAEAAGRVRFTLAADGTASGTLGCNRFSGKAVVEGRSVTFGSLTSTRMACEGPAGEVERKLTGLFAAGPLTWEVQGRALTLTASDGRGLTAKAASAAE
ncbi:META domain-containing protein [Streptomyces sp. cmx-4-9]|uniref:META domain-containing protein n=1 Tax=Streptomyces sp. cmx-4-9 TaxID=2790941 RepID=UPI003980C565